MYQRAFGAWLKSENLSFTREVPYPFLFQGKKIGEYRLDFLVEDLIALEFKVALAMHKRYLNQLLNYLVESEKRLGLCIVFRPEKVDIKRVANGEVGDL